MLMVVFVMLRIVPKVAFLRPTQCLARGLAARTAFGGGGQQQKRSAEGGGTGLLFRRLRPVPPLLGASAAAALCDEEEQKEQKTTRPPWTGVLDKTTCGAGRLKDKVGLGRASGQKVLLAVLDTGVDPGADYLATTPEGLPKIIDVIDATGGGDVDTSRTAKVTDFSLFNEASGRTLRKVDPARWGLKGPKDGVYRVGAKSTQYLWPRDVRERLASEKRKSLAKDHAQWLATARADLSEIQASKDKAALSELEARVNELERAKRELEPTLNSVAPLLDVIVWEEHDDQEEGLPVDDKEGKKKDVARLRGIVVDGAKDPELDKAVPLMDFFEATKASAFHQRFATFGESDLLTYSLKFYGAGETTCVVLPSGDHGTHVAAIAAAYDPSSDENCGIAPSAQVVSVKIGDPRLGTMETGTSLARAIVAAANHDVDLINLSYGEAACVCDTGAFVKKANKLVNNKPGLLFVSSGGNNGPALSTVGAPGSTTRGLLGVGAYVTPAMRKDLYATLRNKRGEKKHNNTPTADQRHSLSPPPSPKGGMYSFSSRGPALDGGLGVDVCAPGGAFASVPKYTLSPQRLMHGTSMASPNAAGSLACLLSALKAEGVAYSPAFVRRAVEATATWVSSENVASHDPMTDRGQGILAVDKAFDAMATLDPKDARLRYDVEVPEKSAGSGAPPARGIYLREPFEVSGPTSFLAVKIKPNFQDDDNVDAIDKASLRRHVVLESTAPDWLHTGDRCTLTYPGRNVAVTVDPSDLPGDAVHCAEIRGYDADVDDSSSPRIPLFRVPVVVAKPRRPPSSQPRSETLFEDETFDAGKVKRVFLAAPHAARSATLTVKCKASSTSSNLKKKTEGDADQDQAEGGYDGDADDARKRLIHLSTVQLVPQEPHSHQWMHKRVWFNDNDEAVYELGDLSGGRTVEICVSQDWNSLDACSLSAKLEFKSDGLAPAEGRDSVVLRGTRSVVAVDCGAPEDEPSVLFCSPTAKLRKWRRPLRPKESSLAPSNHPDRDDFDGAVAYELELKYEFTQPQGGNAAQTATLRFAGDEMIYEAPFEGMSTRCYDKITGKRMGFSDARSTNDIRGLEAGRTYVAAIVIRSDNPKALEKLKDAECWVDWPLRNDVAAKCYGTKQQAYVGSEAKFKDVKLRPGETKVVFVAPPDEQDLPKDLEPGDVLYGSMTFARGANLASGSTRRRAKALFYYAPTRPNKKNGDNGGLAMAVTNKQLPARSNGGVASSVTTTTEEAPLKENPEEESDKPPAVTLTKEDQPSSKAEEKPEDLTVVDELLRATAVANKTALKDLAAVTFERQLKYLKDEATAMKIDDATFAAIAAQLERAMPDRALDVRRVALSRACAGASADWRKDAKDLNASAPVDSGKAASLLEAADAVLAKVDVDAVAAFVATRPPDPLFSSASSSSSDDTQQKDRRKQADDMHKALVEALRWAAEARLALCLDVPDLKAKLNHTAKNGVGGANDVPRLLEDFSSAVSQLDKWVDTKKGGAADARLRASHEALRDRPGIAVATLSTWLNSKQKKNVNDVKQARTLRADLYDSLGWPAWADAERKRLLDDIPPPASSA